jgi:hypothetical protein
VAKKVTARLSGEKQKWSDDSLLFASVGPAAFEMLSNLYIAPDMAFYILADHTSVMERMFEAQARTGEVWLRCAAEAGADFIISAINGLEIFSPTIYEKYLVPQTLRLTEATHALGMRFWVHNCGLMKKLIDMGVYERMGIDVLESFSNPPLGDVSDLRNARIKLGHKIVTRGALNVDLFYDNKLNRIKDRTKVVLEETRGYRHMIGDTNDSLPPYPRENILAVVDEVQKSGRMFRS